MNLPYSRQRRYLTGIDWIIGMLNDLSMRTCGAGNPSQVVAEIDGVVSSPDFRAACTRMLRLHPILHGRPRRDRMNLAPYWEPAGMPADAEARVIEADLPGDAPESEILAKLAEPLDRPLGPPQPSVVFQILRVGPDRAFLAMVFSHWVFDAGGAEQFFARVLAVAAGEAPAPFPMPVEPAHLDRWKERFRAGRTINRHLRWLGQGRAACLPRPRPFPSPRAHFVRVTYDAAQTSRITAKAYRDAGYLLLQPYLLAATLCAAAPLLRRAAPGADDLVVPVSIDRRSGSPEATIFFNHVSFLFFRIPVAAARDRAAAARLLRDQLYQQVKDGIPEALDGVTPLLRIAPLRVLGRLAGLPLQGELASLAHTHLGDSRVTEPAAWAGRLRNVFHLPRIPVPPGLGAVTALFRGCLSITLFAESALVSAGDLEHMAEALRKLPEGE